MISSKHWGKIIVFAIFLLSACQSGQSTPPPPTATSTATAIPAPTRAPEQTPTSTSPVPIKFLVDVEDAIIQVEAKGKFFTPKFGEIEGTPGRGSGFIIDPSGLAVTSNQAVAGAEQILVRVGKDPDQLLSAEVIATSECEDLALIDIEGDDFDFLSISPEPIKQGQKAYLVGFTLGKPEFILDGVEIGILPGDQSPVDLGYNLIGYESIANSGLVGGPIVTPDGRVVGIHLTGEQDQGSSIGIPASSLQSTLDSLLLGRSVNSIGINGQPVNSDDGTLAGMWVYAVTPDSTASEIGLQGGDLIAGVSNVSLVGEDILSDYCKVIREWNPDLPLAIQVFRESSDTMLAGQLNGNKLVVVSNLPILGDSSLGEGTPAAANLAANQPGEVYYLEEFEGPLSIWSRFILQGDETKINTEIKDSRVTFTIDDLYTYLYYFFKPLKQVDVRLDVKTENLGRNNNNVSLICRYSVERGWYEFNIASNGLYWVKRYDPRLQNFVDIGKGASKYINLGQAVNEYGAICKDNELTLIINGNPVRTFTDNTLVTGLAGFSLSSFNVTPITVALDYFKISVP